MPFIGNAPARVPLTSADITDGIITSAKIVDGTIVNADINASAAIDSTKLSGSLGSMIFLAETSASNVASVDLNGYFTSSYDVYKVFIDGIYGSAAAQTLLRFATTGSYTVQTTSYYAQSQYAYGDGTAFLSNESQNWNGSGFNITPNISTTSANTSSVELTIYNPMSSTNQVTVTGNHTTAKGNYEWLGTGTCGGRWNSTTAVTGIRFLMSSGNITARKIRLYGIKNS